MALTPILRFTASMPEIQTRASSSRLFGLLAVVAGELHVLAVRLAPVAVVGLVVEDDDVLLVAQFPTDAADHLVRRFGERAVVSLGENRLRELSGRDLLAQFEGVEVRDEILAWPSCSSRWAGNDVPLAVIVLRVVRQQHAQPVADGDARRDDQKRIGEAGVLRIGELVQRLPGNEHGHDDRLAGAGRHLESHARQAGVGLVVRLAKLVLNPGVAVLFGDLGDVDGRFQGFNLTEEELALAVRLGPVLEELAVVGVTPRYPPSRHRPTRWRMSLTSLFSSMRSFVHSVSNGSCWLPFLLGLGDGDEVRAYSPIFDDVVGDTLVVEAEVPRRLVEGRIEDRVFDDDLSHSEVFLRLETLARYE